jgi:hypothetical protein
MNQRKQLFGEFAMAYLMTFRRNHPEIKFTIPSVSDSGNWEVTDEVGILTVYNREIDMIAELQDHYPDTDENPEQPAN